MSTRTRTTAGYSLTIAPLAYEGLIIVGNSGA